MAERKEYQLNEKQYIRLSNAATAHASRSDEKENLIDKAWEYLGAELGFDWRQVRGSPGHTDRWFTAISLDDNEWDIARKKNGIVVDVKDSVGLAKCVMVGDVKCFKHLPEEGKPLPTHYESPYIMVLEFAEAKELRKAMKHGYAKFGGIEGS